MKKSEPTPLPAKQHARFLETARALGCDEDEAAFDEKLKAVVGPKVKAVPATFGKDMLLPETDKK